MMLFMKFTVGYPLRRIETFILRILKSRDKVREVYFAFGDFPSGRGTVGGDKSEPSWRRCHGHSS